MPVEILCTRIGDHLVPASHADSHTMCERVKPNVYVTVTVSEPLGKLDRWYRGLVARIAEGYGTETHRIHRALMEATGRFEYEYMDSEGAVVRRSLQTTTHWDGADWRDYVREVIPIVLTTFLPEMTEGKLRQEIEQYVGVDLSKVT